MSSALNFNKLKLNCNTSIDMNSCGRDFDQILYAKNTYDCDCLIGMIPTTK